MNFIIEILPKKVDSSVLVYVVRNSQGFPISVCESLDGAKDVIEEQINKSLEAKSAKK